MPQPNGLPTDAWMDARVESYVDGTLSPRERHRFEARLQVDCHWQEQVDRAQAIQGALKTQSPPSAPSTLKPTILDRISGDPAGQEMEDA